MTGFSRPCRTFFLAFVAFLMACEPGVGASCVLLPATSWYNSILAGPYKLEFDDHDPPGPHGEAFVTNVAMRITRPDGTTCTASENVAIVEMPLYIAENHYLYIKTYSGSEEALYIVDARDCATVWQSPQLFGMGFGRTKAGFYLPSVGWLHIKPDCLPGKINGKPYPPSVLPPAGAEDK